MIADGAEFIIERCWQSVGSYGAMEVAGQAFHAENWNVIVERNNC